MAIGYQLYIELLYEIQLRGIEYHDFNYNERLISHLMNV